jgi:hypothetical protein
MSRLLLLICTFLCTPLAFAQSGVTSRLMTFMGSLNSAISSMAMVVGIGFLAASVVQYFQHRKNSLQVPISKPITYLILGLILVALPLLSQVAPGGASLS